MPCLGAFGDWGLHKGAPGSVRHIYSSLCHWERLFCQRETRALARLEFSNEQVRKMSTEGAVWEPSKSPKGSGFPSNSVFILLPLSNCVRRHSPRCFADSLALLYGEASNFSRTVLGYLSGAAVRSGPCTNGVLAQFKVLRQFICWLAELTTFVGSWPNNSRHMMLAKKCQVITSLDVEPITFQLFVYKVEFADLNILLSILSVSCIIHLTIFPTCIFH